MTTEFKLYVEGNLEVDRFRQSLPNDFKVEEKEDGIYVKIDSESKEDERCQYLIDRELDRHYFLTNVKIKAEMVRSVVTGTLTLHRSIQGYLPENIAPQQWNYKLPIQLRLWAIAAETHDVRMKLLILFQIIELTETNYPIYTDETRAPDPVTECKLIRHLIAHAGDVRDSQLKKYCKYLGFPEVMLDITDQHYCNVIASKHRLMEGEAKKIIERAVITK
jgi:hypothetical protein